MYIYSVDRETSKTERARAGRAPASRRARGLRDIFFYTQQSHTAHSRRSSKRRDRHTVYYKYTPRYVLRCYGNTSSLADESKTWARMWNVDLSIACGCQRRTN